MNLDDYAIRSGGYRGTGHGRHLVTQPGAVTRIRDDRQVRELVHDRDRVQIEHVSRRAVEAPHATLAQHDLAIPLGQDVFGAQQQVVDRRGHAALEQYWLVQATDRLEQRVVLHVARTDLDAVGILRHEIRARLIHRFGHDRQPGFAAGELEELEPLLAEALKRIW